MALPGSPGASWTVLSRKPASGEQRPDRLIAECGSQQGPAAASRAAPVARLATLRSADLEWLLQADDIYDRLERGIQYGVGEREPPHCYREAVASGTSGSACSQPCGVRVCMLQAAFSCVVAVNDCRHARHGCPTGRDLRRRRAAG
jgi:hypothetical protein